MFDDEFEDTFGFSGKDADFLEDEMDDMLWEDERRRDEKLDREQRFKNQQNVNKSSFNNKNANPPQKEGCYVATCVYGSYDCEEVWTLRRFRDFYLRNSVLGRMFIKIYYSVSPKIVKIFGNTKWFKNIFKSIIDKIVVNLQNRGYEKTQYTDKNY